MKEASLLALYASFLAPLFLLSAKLFLLKATAGLSLNYYAFFLDVFYSNCKLWE